ncbi:MAG: multicopper oxidase family protein [Paracoccaceae bacterium]
MTLKNISRRSALKFGGATLALATAGGFLGTATVAADARGTMALRIPALDAGQMVDGVRVFDLTVQNGKTEFFEGFDTDTLGINGSYLGPVLRMTAGDTVRMNVNNTLREKTTLHWHGLNIPAVADGGPHQEIEPGAAWSPEFKIVNKASTMWYHSHQLSRTADQVWAGLAGMIFIDDAEADALDLPSDYGVDDIPVVLQDRSFRRNGQMPYEPSMHSLMMGMTGDIAMVNGTIAPFFEVTTSLVRLRLLNGSNGSIYTLAFDDNREFDQIASDGGLLAAPARVGSVRLGPGERAEIVVDMSSGRNVMLVSVPSSDGNGRGMMARMMDSDPVFDFLELRPAATLAKSPALPQQLADLPAVSDGTAVKTRSFELQMSGMGMFSNFSINGKSMKMNRVDEVINMGEDEVWEITNLSPMAHPFHVHNTQFRILDRNGEAPVGGEVGLKDTVVVNPEERVRILIRFDHYSDPKHPYMYHCHILEHEDAGMMGQFTVV